jgi:hypothetical protein
MYDGVVLACCLSVCVNMLLALLLGDLDERVGYVMPIT